MFRKTKKRPPTSTQRLHWDNDPNDEDDEDTRSNLLAPVRKAQRTVVRSSKPRPNNATTSIGYGGGDVESIMQDKTTDGSDADEDYTMRNEASRYDMAALRQLQSEQRNYRATAAAASEQQNPVGMDDMADDFVPLDATVAGDNVLNGEDAILLESRLEEIESSAASVQSNLGEPQQQTVEADLDPVWEQQVARRAGVYPSSHSATTTTNVPSIASPSVHHSGQAMLQQLSDKVDATIQQLQQQQEDLLRSRQQRQAELSHTRENYQRQQAEMQQSGLAVEYYQQLRMRFANWVGGLRQLHKQVWPIQEALHELDAQVAGIERRMEWEDDAAAVLYHYGYLDQIIGRQPDPVVYHPWTAVTVDEFGRDVQSQYTLQREKRRKRRLLINQQRDDSIRGDESDAFLTGSEKETLRERHKALQEALELALSELDEDYTSLQNLVDMFGEWKNTYPEEYKQCHATLSLADLVTPLIQAELCALNDPWNESGGYNESKWLAVIYSAKQKGTIDDAGVERIVEKAVLPSLSDLLDKSGYELLSVRQCQSITGFWNHLSKIVPLSDSPIIGKLRQRMNEYIRLRLADISVAIVKREAIEANSEDEVLDCALRDATVGQMHRVKKVILNLLTYWAPILGGNREFIEIVLSFVSSKFLFMLSSLQGFPQPRFEGTPVDVFQQVYQALETTGWLEEAGMMLHTMPIRAAANMYKGMELQVS